jgi:hypothetical protein
MKKRTPIFRPIVLTFLMAISFGIGVGFLGAGIYEGWQEYKREVLNIRGTTNWTNHTFAFLSNGTPIVRDRRTSFNQTVDVLTHLDGASLSEDEEQNRLYQAGIAYYPSNHLRRLPFSGAPFEELLSRRDRRLVIHDPENNSITWQWEFDSDSADSSLLVARHRSNDQALTYVSPDGFSVNRAARGNGFASPEHSRANGELLEFHSAGKLIGIDLAKKTVRTITDIDPVSDAWERFVRAKKLVGGLWSETQHLSGSSPIAASGWLNFPSPLQCSEPRRFTLWMMARSSSLDTKGERRSNCLAETVAANAS